MLKLGILITLVISALSSTAYLIGRNEGFELGKKDAIAEKTIEILSKYQGTCNNRCVRIGNGIK